MREENVTEFSGVAGQVLQGAISGASMITGLVLGMLMLGGSAVLLMTGAHGLIAPFTPGQSNAAGATGDRKADVPAGLNAQRW